MQHGFDWYARHFGEAGSCRAIGEKTPDYLWANGSGGEGHNPNVHVDLTTEFPDAKYLVVVRNPVDRAISALVHTIKTNRVPFLRPIDRLFEDQHREILKPWGILEKGLYARQIGAYLELIPRDRLKILVFEQDILGKPRETLEAVCEYLDVDPGFQFEELGKKRNESPMTRRSLHRARMKHRKWRLAEPWSKVFPDQPVSVGTETRQKLSAYYRDENQLLGDLLGRSLPEWE